MFVDWKSQYSENECTAQNNLYQATNTELEQIISVWIETQKTLK